MGAIAKRDTLCLAAAIALHAMVVATVALRPAPPPPDVVSTPAPMELQIIVLREPPAPELATTLAPTTPFPRLAAARAPSQRASSAAPEAPAESAPEVAPYSVDPRVPAAPGHDVPTVSFDLPAGAAVAKDDGDAQPTAPREDDADRLRRTLLADAARHERKTGVGRAGDVGSQVIAAATPAIRGAGGPDGWAVLDVELDPSGRVRSVTVSESEASGFAAVAAAVRSGMAKQAIALPSAYRGAKVRLKIVLRAQLPSGQKAHAEGVNLVRPDKEPGKESIAPPQPKHLRWWRDAVPGLPVWDLVDPRTNSFLGGGKVDGAVVSAPILSFDPSDIGAKRALMVAVSVLDVVPR